MSLSSFYLSIFVALPAPRAKMREFNGKVFYERWKEIRKEKYSNIQYVREMKYAKVNRKKWNNVNVGDESRYW